MSEPTGPEPIHPVPTHPIPTHPIPTQPAPWIRVAAGTTRPQERPLRRRRVIVQVVVAALLVIVAVALVGIFAARKLAEAEAVTDAANIADLLAETVVQPELTDGLLTGDPAAMAAFDRVITEHVLSDAIVRVKLWDPSGRIVYSDEKALIGQVFSLGEEEIEVLQQPRIQADVSDLDEPENVFERGRGKLLEAYRPVWTPNGTTLLFETYFRYDEVTARSGQLWRGFAGVTVSSILLLVVLLLPVVWRLLDRLRRAQSQREELLQHTVDASAQERRRIAGTLHDGVVQDLAATSFSVAGAAERAASAGQHELAAELRTAAATVRTSIGGLRSLLVEIYPPSLASAGLAAALQDLLNSLRTRGIEVVAQLDSEPLPPEVERLVFRVAQECLTNVTRHSGADRVRLSLERTNGGAAAVLEINDNGTGFDAASTLAAPPAGHFGLRVLADVVADAGAVLDLSSRPGAGTGWRLEVPLK